MKYQFHNSTIIRLFIVFSITLTSSADHADIVDNNNLERLKKTFNLSHDAWLSADIETYFMFVHPTAKNIFHNGYKSIIKEKNKDRPRQEIQKQNQIWDERISNMTFSCQENTAIVTYNRIRINKKNEREVRLKISEVWIFLNEKWLLLHRHSSDLTWQFKNAIREFERTDDTTTPPLNSVVVIGSSSIRGWHNKIQKDLAPITIIPRGFGGSTMSDAQHSINRIIIPYRPRALVIYEGDNDLARGCSSKRFKTTFLNFIARVHRNLPECRIYFLSIKLAPSNGEYGLR